MPFSAKAGRARNTMKANQISFRIEVPPAFS